MIKLKSLLESVSFDKDDKLMIISTPKGDWKVRVFSFVREDKKYYNWDIITPPDHYSNFEVNGQIHKMAVGGKAIIGNRSENLEQVQAGLSQKLKELGMPYVSVTKIKVSDTDSPENKEFTDKLKNVMADFQKEMEKPENQPKDFGKGPPEFTQWISKTDITDGRLQWVIDNYGDFWVVIKWSYSPRQQIKASELLKNYDRMMRGKEANQEYAREIFIRKNPFEGI
jgi:hypothetical protein